jgi:hypothetical protein
VKYVIAISVLVAAIGCKQGQGEVCQVDADCKTGLICNLGKMPPVCDNVVEDQIDAEVPVMTDAGPTDAATDAVGDAAHD